jgi:hypothetical protein
LTAGVVGVVTVCESDAKNLGIALAFSFDAGCLK